MTKWTKPWEVGRTDYERVPLAVDRIQVCPVQLTSDWKIDPKNPKPVIRKNLDRMLELCTQAALWESKLLVFPEYTLEGKDFNWTREDWQRVAIEVPDGEEMMAIRQKAKELGVYIVFCAHTKHKDWPGHYFNSSMIVDSNGELILWHWKAYAGGPSKYAWETTVHDVLDEFVERYGWDAVWPVARTPIGNIATLVCSEAILHEHARMYAMKGAEILCFCMCGYGWEHDNGKFIINSRAECITSNLYGIYSNSFDGGSMIIDPHGRILNQAADHCDTPLVRYVIPIEDFRKNHTTPFVRTELIVPVYQQYVGKYPPNLYSDYGVPSDGDAVNKLAEEHARW